jgi:hypothetical protein
MSADHKIPWYGHLIFATMFACLFSAVPFWTVGHPFWTVGLTVHQASIAAVIIFPITLIAYAVAIRK